MWKFTFEPDIGYQHLPSLEVKGATIAETLEKALSAIKENPHLDHGHYVALLQWD